MICQLNERDAIVYGGESGIRTHVRVTPKHAFQACAFSHSAISPQGKRANSQLQLKSILAEGPARPTTASMAEPIPAHKG